MAASDIKPTHPEDVHPPSGQTGGSPASLFGGSATGAAIPFPPPGSGAPNTSTSLGLMDAAGEKVAFIFQVPKTGTLDKVEFRAGSIPNALDNGLRISFQDVDPATGDPDGVQDQFRDIASPVASGWNVPGLMTSDGTDGGVKRSVTAGQHLAVVADFVSFVALDSINPFVVWGSMNTVFAFPYGDAFTAAWARSGTGGFDIVLKYSDGTYVTYPGAMPISNALLLTVGNATTPDEVALKIVPPVPLSINGAWAVVDLDGDAEIVLYDAGNNVLMSRAFDAEIRHSSPGAAVIRFAFDEIALAVGATYRLAIKPTTATTLTAGRIVFDNAAVRNAAVGSAFAFSSRTDAGAWSDVDLDLLVAGLYVSKVNS